MSKSLGDKAVTPAHVSQPEVPSLYLRLISAVDSVSRSIAASICSAAAAAEGPVALICAGNSEPEVAASVAGDLCGISLQALLGALAQ